MNSSVPAVRVLTCWLLVSILSLDLSYLLLNCGVIFALTEFSVFPLFFSFSSPIVCGTVHMADWFRCAGEMFLFPLIYLCDFFENSTLNLDLSTVNQSYEWVEREIVFRPC